MSICGMKFQHLSACLFLMTRSTASAFSIQASTAGVRTYRSLAPSSILHQSFWSQSMNARSSLLKRCMSSADSEMPEIRHIGKEEMKQILMEHEEMINAGLDSPYFVLDVRTEPEVMQTGKLSSVVPTLPVQVMMPPYNALQMDDEDFEEAFGFAKPPKDAIMVFSCAAGIRSVSACKFAHQAGYKQCVNYMGGAQEWFYL